MRARTRFTGALAVRSLVLCPLACAVYNDDSVGQNPSGGFGAESAGGAAGANAKGGETNGPASAGTSPKPQGGAAGRGGSAGATSAGSGDRDDLPVGGEASSDGGEGTGSSGSAGKGGTSATGGAGGTGSGGKAGAGSGGKGGAGGGGTAGAAGSAGSGTAGGATAPACSDHPLSARSAWVASASHSDAANSGLPANLLDGKTTRWSSGKAQSGDEWLQIDFGASATINHVNLQQGDDTNDYPRAYSVIVSNTPKDTSGAVRVSGSGKSGVSTAILLPALASGRYLLIKQSSTSLSWWSAEEIEVSCSD